MRTFIKALSAAALSLSLFSGCGGGAKTPDNSAAEAKEDAKEQGRSDAAESRFRIATTRVQALPDIKPMQQMEKAKILELMKTAKLEMAKKVGPVIPPEAIGGMNVALDEV